jgi:TPR repeat protein
MPIVPSTTAAGPYEDGREAFKRYDQATAFRLWRSEADQGNAKAQSALGLLYRRGWGVTQNKAEAAKWYYLAADQGVDDASGGAWRDVLQR